MIDTSELSDVQKSILGKMEKGKWYSAYDLKASLASLRAMERTRLVKSKEGLGSVAFPRVCIAWQKV